MTNFYCEFLGRFHNIVSETTHKVTAISAESKFILFPSEDQDLHFFDIVFMVCPALRSPQCSKTPLGVRSERSNAAIHLTDVPILRPLLDVANCFLP